MVLNFYEIRNCTFSNATVSIPNTSFSTTTVTNSHNRLNNNHL
ncbi:mechanosensitive ion channel domain-containing protein [Sediminitomix flava]